MDLLQNQVTRSSEREYNRALRRAFFRGVYRWLGSKCNDLVSVAGLLDQVQIIQQRDLGIQRVPVERIVGSGRSQDFDLAFNPKRQEHDQRWLRVAQANMNGVSLPPPSLLKIEKSYFVVDGNHRISVARTMGRKTIEARVAEIKVESLEQWPDCSRLGFRKPAANECSGH